MSGLRTRRCASEARAAPLTRCADLFVSAGPASAGARVRVCRRALVVRAEAAAAATATVPAPSAANTTHEELQKYGVFRLSYNTANVSPRCLTGRPMLPSHAARSWQQRPLAQA